MPETGFVLGPAGAGEGAQAEGEPGRRSIHCSIQGTVRLDGEPQADTRVHIFAMRRGGEFLDHGDGATTTDAAGQFSFGEVPGNTYRLSVSQKGVFARGAWIRCQNDGEVIQADLDLERAGIHVTGRVTDLEGAPLAQSSVLARGKTVNVQALEQALRVPVGPDGGFGFWLPDAGFDVVGRAVGHQGHVLQVPEDRAEVELLFRLERLSVLSGTVIGPDGPQAGVKVSASTENADGSSVAHSTTSVHDGRFSVECGPSEASLTAWDGERWAHEVVPARQEGADPREVVLRLEPGRSLTGRVVLQNGSPASMVSVGVHSMPTGIGGVVQADMQGAFQVSGLRPGESVMLFCLRDSRPWEERMLTIPPEQDQVELVFVPTEEE